MGSGATHVPFLAEKSPPWIMKLLMILWNGEPLKWSGWLVVCPMPASPVDNCLKFSAVCVHTNCQCTEALLIASLTH